MSTDVTITFGGSSLSRAGTLLFLQQGEAGIPLQPQQFLAEGCSLKVSVLGEDAEQIKWQADLVHSDGAERLLTYRETKPGNFPAGVAKWAETLGIPFELAQHDP